MLMCLGNVEETLVPVTGSRVGSFMSLQDGKWRVFTSWCSDHQLDPVNCPVGTLLEFLQERLTTGLAPSTLRVYVVARHKWICLRLEGRLTVHSGSPSRIQLHSDWTRWCRRGRGFICMHFPRSLCSRESWREFAGTGFYYFSLPHTLTHSFGWNVIGERHAGISFPPWYFEAEVLQAFYPPPFRMRTRKGTICFAQCGH